MKNGYNIYTDFSKKIILNKNNINNKIQNVIVFAYEYFDDIKMKFNKYNVIFFKPIPFKRIK